MTGLAPSNPAGSAPARREGSVRRTSHIDTSWPDGRGGPMLMRGRARDILTISGDCPPIVVAEDGLEALLAPNREILSIETFPKRDAAGELVGSRGGGHLGSEIARILPRERVEHTPLYLLLDDLSGASLVANWAWSRWREDWITRTDAEKHVSHAPVMEGVCVGFRPGSAALIPGGRPSPFQNSAIVPSLPSAEDPSGWHDLPPQTGVGMRRARRIDVCRDATMEIDSGFQDSATTPTGERMAVHEYKVAATADQVDGKLIAISADPRILPYAECPSAVANIGLLVGTRLDQLRETVLEQLRGTAGCTHLNDVIRAFADIPGLFSTYLSPESEASSLN